MKKILLITLSLFMVGCNYKWTQENDCLNEIPVAEQTGMAKATRLVEYEEVTTLDFDSSGLPIDKTSTHINYSSQCSVKSCQAGYSLVYPSSLAPNNYSGNCFKTQDACSASELPANASSGIKTIVSASGRYSACQITECSSGYSLQADNTCAGGIIVVPPPFFPPPMPPPMPPVSCTVAPTDPICVP